MTPTLRLIGLSFGLAVLLALSLSLTGSTAWGWGLGALLLCIPLLDAARLYAREIPVTVSGPEEVHQSVHQPGTWDLDWRQPDPAPARRVDVGIALPGLLRTESDIQQVAFPPGASRVRTRWEITPLKRGSFDSDAVYVREYSPFQFWTRRRSVPHSTRFLVHPDLRQDRRTLGAMLTKSGRIGTHLQRQAGQGREYDQVREYQPGDSPLDIHWKATAKRNSLVSRTYQIERTQNVVLALDTSRLSSRLHPLADGLPPEPVLERYVNATNLLALASLRSGDRFGFLAFSDRVEVSLRPGNGPQQLAALQQRLYKLTPRPVYPDYEEWGREMRARFRRRSLVVVCTDLSDATAFEHLEPVLRLLSRIHLVAVAMIPLPGVEPLFEHAPEGQDPYQRLAGHLLWQDLHAYRQRLRALSIPLLLSSSEQFVVDVVNHYISVKKSQRL